MSRRRSLRRWGCWITVAAVVAGLCGLLALMGSEAMWKILGDLVDRTFLFYPRPEWVATPEDGGVLFEDLMLTTEDGTAISAWYVPARDPAAPVLLFCHGNAGNISHRVHNLVLLNRIGISSLIFDYPGFGRSGGHPLEAGVYQSAQTAYRYLRDERGVPDRKIVLFGRSLGAAVAVELAAGGHGRALIIECAFTDLYEMGRHLYPALPMPRRLERKYPTAGRLAEVRMPVLIIHGEADRLVPLSMARRLHQLARRPKEFYLIPGAGHDDTLIVGGGDYGERIRSFVTTWVRP
jgi:fermentation-respiration switch protein FrsA (DUF1100 family)